MLKYLREYRFYITLFFFVLIPIIAIDTTNRAPRDYRFYDRVIVFVTAPIQHAITWTLDKSVSLFQNYVYLVKTREENSVILAENRRLLGEIAQLRETRQENERLRSLLGIREQFELKIKVARVIAKDVSTEFRAIRIDRGEKDGIKRDMAVMTHEGIVGRVLRTTPSTADVVTILDLLSAVDSVVERSRAHGIVAGMTDEVCRLKFALRNDDIRPGDRLTSSGLGGVFPKGIPVGYVSKIRRLSYGTTQQVEIQPSVNFSKLEEVLVITERRQLQKPKTKVQ